MKVLLDENLPHKLRQSLTGHDVRSVNHMGWSGEKNGELLKLCEAEGFDVLVTGDQNLRDRHHVTLSLPSSGGVGT